MGWVKAAKRRRRREALTRGTIAPAEFSVGASGVPAEAYICVNTNEWPNARGSVRCGAVEIGVVVVTQKGRAPAHDCACRPLGGTRHLTCGTET